MFAIEWRRGPRPFSGGDGLAAVGLVALVASLLWPALPVLQRLAPACHFRHLTGLPCGTCGFTRAFVRMAHLDWADAFAVSPLGAALFLTWVGFSLWVLASRLSPRVPLPALRADGPWGRALARFGVLGLFVVNWGYLLVHTWLLGAPPP